MSAISLVKKRMAEMRDGIDESEIRTKEYEQEKREVDARNTVAEGLVNSLRNRVFQLQCDLEKTKKRVDEQTAKLDDADGRTQDNDTVRKDLEGRETDNDQDLVVTEQTSKDAKVNVTENTQKYDDAVNKFKVLEGDLERTYDRMTSAQGKVQNLEHEASQVNTDLKDLETRDEESSVRETSLEDQVRFLENQLKEMEQRADHAERNGAKLQRLKETTLGRHIYLYNNVTSVCIFIGCWP